MNINIKKINRYIIYLISLFIIALGASLSIKANLGTSSLICIPYVSSLILNISVGTASFVFSIILIAIEVILLRSGLKRDNTFKSLSEQYFQYLLISH